jgi:hypothetical protein
MRLYTGPSSCHRAHSRAATPSSPAALAPTQLVVNALFASIPALGNVMLVCLLFYLVFGIIAVNLFAVRRMEAPGRHAGPCRCRRSASACACALVQAAPTSRARAKLALKNCCGSLGGVCAVVQQLCRTLHQILNKLASLSFCQPTACTNSRSPSPSRSCQPATGQTLLLPRCVRGAPRPRLCPALGHPPHRILVPQRQP